LVCHLEDNGEENARDKKGTEAIRLVTVTSPPIDTLVQFGEGFTSEIIGSHFILPIKFGRGTQAIIDPGLNDLESTGTTLEVRSKSSTMASVGGRDRALQELVNCRRKSRPIGQEFGDLLNHSSKEYCSHFVGQSHLQVYPEKE